MDVLGNAVAGARPGGTVLDLQVIRPHPVVESDGEALSVVDGEPLFRRADAAVAAVDALVAAGRLSEEAVDDHDVLSHYASGAELVDDLEPKERSLAPDDARRLRAVARPCAIRERCRLRRRRVD